MFAVWYPLRDEIYYLYARSILYLVTFCLAKMNGGRMAGDRRPKDRHEIATGASLAGILALMIDEREDRVRTDKDAAKTEVLLSNTGLSIDDIAALMGKSYDAIRVSLNRNRRP